MKKLCYLLIALLWGFAMQAQTATDLYISEYVEGSSNNKAIELYNGTSSAIDLSGYSIMKQTNGAGDYTNEVKLSGSLAAGKTYLIINSSASADLKAKVTSASEGITNDTKATGFNGNDAVALFKGATKIDEIGVFGQVADWGKDITLRRACEASAPKATYAAADWEEYAKDDFSDLGKHCATAAEAPSMSEASATSTTKIEVLFSKKLEKASAEMIANYSLDQEISVQAAALQEDGKTVRLTVSALSVGVAYALSVSGVKDLNGQAMETTQTKTVKFGSSTESLCVDIAALRAKASDNTTVFVLQGPVTLTHKVSNRNQKYIQDASGAILIDDPKGIITTAMERGARLSDIQGTLSDYYGLLQFVVTANVSEVTPGTVDIEPLEVSLTQLKDVDFMKNHQCKLIKVSNVSFADAGNSQRFVNGKLYRLSDGTTTDSLLRTHFYSEDYIGTNLPEENLDIFGIAILSYEKYYIVPRNNTDLGGEPITTEVASIEELRKRPLDNVYVLTSPAVLTYSNTTYRNQKFIQDASAAIVLDDAKKIVTTQMAEGAELKGIKGKLVDYFGLLQFEVLENITDVKPTSDITIEPTVLTLSDLKDPSKALANQCKLIKFENVRFMDAGNFANGKNYRLTDGTISDSNFRSHFFNVDYIGTAIPSGSELYNLIGILVLNRGEYAISPRRKAEILKSTALEYGKDINTLAVYPNPSKGTFYMELDGEYEVSVFNMNGQRVWNGKAPQGSYQLNLESLQRGFYMLQLNGKQGTKVQKLMITQ